MPLVSPVQQFGDTNQYLASFFFEGGRWFKNMQKKSNMLLAILSDSSYNNLT